MVDINSCDRQIDNSKMFARVVVIFILSQTCLYPLLLMATDTFLSVFGRYLDQFYLENGYS